MALKFKSQKISKISSSGLKRSSIFRLKPKSINFLSSKTFSSSFQLKQLHKYSTWDTPKTFKNSTLPANKFSSSFNKNYFEKISTKNKSPTTISTTTISTLSLNSYTQSPFLQRNWSLHPRRTYSKETLENIFAFKKAKKKKDRKKFAVILTSDKTPELGFKGEIRTVSKGHYRNYLWPKVYGIRYSEEAQKLIGEPDQKLIEEREYIRRQKRAVKRLSGKEFFFVKLAPDEKNITYPLLKSDIIRTLKKQYHINFLEEDIDFPPNGVIDTLGTTEISVKYQGANIPLKITVKKHNHKTPNGLPPKPKKREKRRKAKMVDTHQKTQSERMKKYGSLIEELRMKRFQSTEN